MDETQEGENSQATAFARKTVFIRNLPFETSNEKLEKEFSDYGPVKKAFVVKDRGRYPGSQFAIFYKLGNFVQLYRLASTWKNLELNFWSGKPGKTHLFKQTWKNYHLKKFFLHYLLFMLCLLLKYKILVQPCVCILFITGIHNEGFLSIKRFCKIISRKHL